MDYIFTFDDFGVSGHPNHIATYKGVKLFHDCLRPKKSNFESFTESNQQAIRIFTLKSVSMLRKFVGVLNLFVDATKRKRRDILIVQVLPY
jgi:N-acetylglucosaminylphosphatidylinositol deacetylase